MAKAKSKKVAAPAVAKKPIAVIISDLHMSLKFLEPASAALGRAIDEANRLNVPLICAGDFHDTKALHRSECIRASRKLLITAIRKPFLLVGNHDKENEKAEAHALDCYEDLATIVNEMMWLDGRCNLAFIPYQHDKEKFLTLLEEVPNECQVICHQGVAGAKMGEYVTDKSQVDPSVFDRFTKPVYSGHYHCNQTIGNFTYFGTPYTTSFSEANDGPKGFWILFEDGTMELRELPIRRHIVVESTVENIPHIGKFPPETLLWVKLHGTSKELSTIKKAELGEKVLGHGNFKLDRIKTDEVETVEKSISKSRSFAAIMEALVAAEKDHAPAWKELNDEAA